MFERFKIRAACDELNIEPRMARVLVHLHRLTDGGKKEEGLLLKEGEDIQQKLGVLAKFQFRDDYLGEQIRDVIRLYTDTEFRNAMLEAYRKISPRVSKMGLGEMLKALTSYNLNKY